MASLSALILSGSSVTALGGDLSAFGEERGVRLASPSGLTIQSFKAQLNTSFRLYTERKECIMLELLAVEPLKFNSDKVEGFRMRFLNRFNGPLQQRTYTIEHDKMGTFLIFLVPMGEDRAGYYSEAIFNSLRTQSGPAGK